MEESSGIDPKEIAKEYDFSAGCNEHLVYIGTNLKDRDVNKRASNEHDSAKEYIKKTLIQAGYDDVFEIPFTHQRTTLGDVVCRIAGKSSEKKIVLGAHYDGDGAGDNGSGVALLLGVAEGIVSLTPEYDVDIVFFDCEEEGDFEGSRAYLSSLSSEEKSKIEFMINVDSLAFGDYPNIYGGKQSRTGKVSLLSAYELAVSKAKNLGFTMWDTSDLEGYYEKHGTGPAIEEDAFYTNPWTKFHDSPNNNGVYSPTTIDASDHVPFSEAGIPIVYFEATNWFASGDGGYEAYSGYFETYDSSIGYYGMFMNTSYDTLENLELYFPGRALAHFKLYSPLLASLLLYPTQENTPSAN